MTPFPPSDFDAPGLRCEIRASKRLAPILASIVQTCAGDLGLLIVVERALAGNAAIPAITLTLPVERMIEPDQTWCLACRVACFCPDARVSVLVTGVPEASARAARDTAATAA